jgi:hypothetical protein
VDDLVQPGSISGEVGWQRQTIFISAGSHVIKWVYCKDESVSLGSDCAYVDYVRFIRPTKPGIDEAIQLLLLQ